MALDRTRTLRGALAGAAAAAVWAAQQPLDQRVFGVEYDDVELLGRFVTDGPAAYPIGLALHIANGALFGAVFEHAGGHGVVRGVLAAQLENVALWPGMVIVDRVHPDRRAGVWPPLLLNRRVFAYEVTVHALFGAVLGLLTRRGARPATDSPGASTVTL
jgi:hypothetical protein